MKNIKIPIFYQLLISFWILFIFGYYILTVGQPEGVCSVANACFNIFSHKFQFYFQPGNVIFIDAWTSTIRSIINIPHMPSPDIFIAGSILFIYLASFFYDRFVEKKKEMNLKLSVFHLLVIFSAIFFLVYSRVVVFYNLKTPIHYTGILIRYPTLLIEVGVIVLVVLSFGKKLKDLILGNQEFSQDLLFELLLSFAFGISATVILLYFLALFKIFIFKAVIILAILMILISAKQIWYWLKHFFRTKITFQTRYSDPYIFLIFIFLVIAAINFLELIRPLPMGFDELTVYMNNSHLMAQAGALSSGIMSYYWELFTGLGFILFNKIEIAFMLSFTAGIFAFLSVFYVTRFYCLKRDFSQSVSRLYALLCAVLFFTMPAVFFQLSKDMKIDLSAMFFAFMSLAMFWFWKYNYDNPKAKTYLFVSAFFVGIAFAIKYTSTMFIVTLFIYLLWVLWQKKDLNLKKIPLILACAFLVILPVLPISIRNIYQTKSLAIADIRFGDRTNQVIKNDPPFIQTPGIVNNFYTYLATKRTSDREEVQRYVGYDKGIKKYLLLPFRMTNNSLLMMPYMNIGYVLMVFIPILILFIRFRKRRPSELSTAKIKPLTSVKHPNGIDKKDDLRIVMFILGIFFWLIWLVLAPGLFWYGFAGFIFLFIYFIESYHRIRLSANKLLLWIANFVIIIWLVSTYLVKTTYLPQDLVIIEPVGVQYARGEINAQKYAETKFSDYLVLINQINDDILKHPDNPPKVYLVGTFYKYLIAENDKTVVDDQLFDRFAYAFQDQDNTKTLERFKNSGIKYLIVDKTLIQLDRTPEKTLEKKTTNFINFVMTNRDKINLVSKPDDDGIFIGVIHD